MRGLNLWKFSIILWKDIYWLDKCGFNFSWQVLWAHIIIPCTKIKLVIPKPFMQFHWKHIHNFFPIRVLATKSYRFNILNYICAKNWWNSSVYWFRRTFINTNCLICCFEYERLIIKPSIQCISRNIIYANIFSCGGKNIWWQFKM